MDKFELNLATAPFERHRVHKLMLGVALVVLVSAGAVQVIGYSRASSRAREISAELIGLRAGWQRATESLAKVTAELNQNDMPRQLSELQYLNSIVARRDFSWTSMFADLEQLVPGTVRLLSLRPEVGENGVVLRMTLRGKDIKEISRFIAALESSPRFAKIVVSMEDRREVAAPTESDVEVLLTAGYKPGETEQ